MAKLMVVGKLAQVELTDDPETGYVTASCVLHDAKHLRSLGLKGGWCKWTADYGTYDDALRSPDVERHADEGR